MHCDGIFSLSLSLFIFEIQIISENYTYANFDNWHGLSATKIPVIIHEMYIYITIKDTQVQFVLFLFMIIWFWCFAACVYTLQFWHTENLSAIISTELVTFAAKIAYRVSFMPCTMSANVRNVKRDPEREAWTYVPVSVLQLRENFHKIKMNKKKKSVRNWVLLDSVRHRLSFNLGSGWRFAAILLLLLLSSFCVV